MILTVAHELERAAAEVPSRTFLRVDGEELSYLECAERVRTTAAALLGRGVRAGDVVALMMGTSADHVVLWFALSRIGAVHAPLNTALVGDLLAHALRTSAAVVALADEEHLEALRTTVAARDLSTPVHDAAWALEGPRQPGAPALLDLDDLATATLLFTSGTTGPSKACALSHRYLIRQGQLHVRSIEATADDVLFTPFPLFHIDGATLTVVAALCARATAALAPRFSVSRFWDQVRDNNATVFNFMGATLSLLWKQEPAPRDRDQRVRLAWGVPLPEWHREFEERFGLQLRTVYGLTDAGVCVYDPLHGERRLDSAGRVLPEFDVRIDTSVRGRSELADAGEILVRGREPGLVMNGYFGDPTATARTIVDGWVRTGDLGSLDADGYLTFLGRISDSIRRRGENISAQELEALVASHPDVLEVAALGVPSELTEEDVLVVVVARPGAALQPSDVHAHCAAVAPRHMVPRYVRVVESLPRTPTEKVEKFRLREQWPASDAWDAESVPRA